MTANLTERAEFYLCLARAFLPPREDAVHDAIRLRLADDLGELASELGYPAAGALHDLRNAVGRLPDHLTLLQGYSRLFLAPPAPVPLNAGLYLDGAVMGSATAALEKCYRQAGFQRSADFHDLPDHIALQLEFVARLCASEAAGSAPALRADDFLASFVRYWVPSFVAALERACTREDPAYVYLCLARLLRIAVDHELRDYHPGRAQIGADGCSDATPAGSSPA
jgi:TorA maturation chaperone TorD